MPRTIKFEGRTITVPDDFDDAEIASVLGQPGQSAAPATTAPTEPPMPRPVQPGTEPRELGTGVPSGVGTFGRSLKVGVQGAGQGLAELAGAPVDLVTGGLNMGSGAVNMLAGRDREHGIPAIQHPFLGSESISNAASKVAQSAGYEPVEPYTMKEKIGYETNRFGSNVAGTVGSVMALPARAASQVTPRLTGMNPAPQTIAEKLQQPYMNASARTAAGDAVGAAGAGTANALYHEGGSEAVHKMPGGSVLGPLADAVVPVIGGVAGATVAQGTAAIAKGARNSFDKRTGQNLETSLPVDPATGRHYTSTDVDAAAALLQRVTSSPANAAAEIGDRFNTLADAGATRQEMPPATAVSDPGMASLGAAMKRSNPVPHMENEQRVNTAARRTLDQAVPAGADPWQFPQSIEATANQRRAAAQEDVAHAESDVNWARDNRVRHGEGLPQNPRESRTAASQTLDRQIVDQSLNTMDAEKARRYGDIPNTPIPSEPLHALAADIRNRHRGLPPNTQSQVVPESILSDIESLGTHDAGGNVTPRPVGLQDLNQINNNVGAQIADARANNAPPGRIDNLRRIQGQIREMVDQHPDAAEATRYYREDYGPVYGRGAGPAYDFRQDVNKDRLSRTAAPPSETGGRFIAPGSPETSEALRRIVSTIPDPTQTHAAIRQYLISDMAASGGVLNRDGMINPPALRRWADKNAANLDLAPGVRDEVESLIARSQRGEALSGQYAADLRAAQSRLGQTEQQLNSGAFKGVIGADPEHAAASIFNSNNPEAAAAELVGALGPNFVEGRNAMKAATRDYLLQKGTPKLEHTIEGGAKPISFQKLDETFDQQRPTLSHIFSPEEMHAMETARKFLAPFRNLEVSGTAANVDSARMSQEMWRMVEAGMKIHYGMLKGGGITRTLKTIAAALPSNSGSVKSILEQMQFDPELAQHLLTRDVAEVNSPMWTKRLFQLMGVEEAARNSSKDEKRK